MVTSGPPLPALDSWSILPQAAVSVPFSLKSPSQPLVSSTYYSCHTTILPFTSLTPLSVFQLANKQPLHLGNQGTVLAAGRIRGFHGTGQLGAQKVLKQRVHNYECVAVDKPSSFQTAKEPGDNLLQFNCGK